MLIQGSAEGFLVMFAYILEYYEWQIIRLWQAVKQEQEEQERQWQILKTLHYTFLSSAVDLFSFKEAFQEEADRFCLEEIIIRPVLFWPAQPGFIFSFF